MGWFSSGFGKFLVWSKDTISVWVEEDVMETSFRASLQKVVYALFLSFLALGGAIVGGVVGGIKGYSSSVGFLRGAAIGAMAAAISLIQLLEFLAHGEPFSKLGFLLSLLDGKNFNEWVSPAVLKAYQWMVMEPVENIISFDEDDYHVEFNIEGREMKGLSADYIETLPKYKLTSRVDLMLNNITNNNNNNNARSTSHITSGSCCPICLEDLREGEVVRKLPTCRHSFHMTCIDQWLSQCGSCPLCRQQLL
ncbi:NEP1-interacting protein-like 1 [Impatiens glandulifera]|uniref:NEP1-interacting protein-like 1 n=1 Tax=Impatiens glandulifera TaxID=253017 RepID=UPI001FB07BFB|nr:NEP1-interacting protein-like 1 [Impatiens glandulifera]